MLHSLGERLRVARARLRMSQAELARKIGISTISMNQIETGNSDPRASRITKMAEVLGVSTDYLLRGRKDEDEDEEAPRRRVAVA
jgi:transcriptional regulator with XRE-family HTH domain